MWFSSCCLLAMYTVSFHTFGCKLNQAETAKMVQDFKDQGYQVVPWSQGADVSVLNTCTVTARSDAKCRQTIRHIQKLKSDTTIIVAGCYSQMDKNEVSCIPGVDYVLGTQEKFSIFNFFPGPGKLLKPRVYVSAVKGRNKIKYHGTGDYLNHTRAFLKIQNGCNRRCAYCIVPLVRGPSRSVPLDDLVNQVDVLIQKGYREIVLTGIHIGDYGSEWASRSLLTSLLRILKTKDDIVRIRLSSLDPEDVSEELLNIIAESEIICRHFHIPLQSGSDTILKLMDRCYSIADYLEKIEKTLSKFKNLGLGTDVIVGFPGETDELFEETYSFVNSLPFTYLHVFPFSPRKGTKADLMRNQVPSRIRMERAKVLRVLGQKKREIFMRKWLEKEVKVLLESQNMNGLMSGFTSEYVRVQVPYNEKLINKLVSVRIEEIGKTAVRGKVIGE